MGERLAPAPATGFELAEFRCFYRVGGESCKGMTLAADRVAFRKRHPGGRGVGGGSLPTHCLDNPTANLAAGSLELDGPPP